MRKISTLAMLAVVLLFSGCKEKKEQKTETSEAQTPASLVQTVEFNGKKIPMTVFYSRETDGDYHYTDSLNFEYEGKKHLISLNGLSTWRFENPDSYELIEVTTDYNFDGYMDISILANVGTHNSESNIFIYNPQTKEYYHHKELSEGSDIEVDAENQAIRKHGMRGNAGLTYSVKDYKWVNTN